MCGDPRAPSVLFVLRVRPLRPMPLGAVSLPVWSFADWTGNWGRLRCLRAIPLEVPLLSTVIASPPLSTWVPLRVFLRLFKNSSHSHCKGFPGGAVVKNPPASAGHAASTPGSGRSPGVRNGNPCQYSFLDNSMDRGDWKATVHGVAKSWI